MSAGLIGAARIATTASSVAGFGQGSVLICRTSARISVPFVNDNLYSFAHSMNSAPHPTPQPVARNLQTGARVALIGLGGQYRAGRDQNRWRFVRQRLCPDRRRNRIRARRRRFSHHLGRVEVCGATAGRNASLRSRESGTIRGHCCFAWCACAALGLAISSVRELFLPRHGPASFTLIVLVLAVVSQEKLCSLRHSHRAKRRKHRDSN